jgi:hypothetical protein
MAKTAEGAREPKARVRLHVAVLQYDALGVTRTAFGALDWKMLIFFERAVPITPNAPW